jgi:hypothetical protein
MSSPSHSQPVSVLLEERGSHMVSDLQRIHTHSLPGLQPKHCKININGLLDSLDYLCIHRKRPIWKGGQSRTNLVGAHYRFIFSCRPCALCNICTGIIRHKYGNNRIFLPNALVCLPKVYRSQTF